MQGKGEKFTYFLVGEDKSERLRRISVGKKSDTNITPCNSLTKLYKQNSTTTVSTASLTSNNSQGSVVDINGDHINIFMNGNVKYIHDTCREFDV